MKENTDNDKIIYFYHTPQRGSVFKNNYLRPVIILSHQEPWLKVHEVL